MQTTIERAFYMFIFLTLIFTSFDTFAQSCNSELKVINNRDVRSASVGDPTGFQLELTNNTSSNQTYQIEVTNYDGTFTVDGKNPARLSANSILNTSVHFNNQQSNSLSVPARSTVVFKTSVSVPSGTASNRWGGLEVKAINTACPEGSLSALLKLFVTDNSE